MTSRLLHHSALAATLVTIAACSGKPPESAEPAKAPAVAGTPYAVRDTIIAGAIDASGVAEALRSSTLSTKLMGTVLTVLVNEGDVVRAGQPLARIDARDIAARESQVAASIADAEAQQHDALTNANRIRALYADSAATRAQLDAAETGLARAEAGVRAARAASGEVGVMRSYAQITAPFAGVVTHRFVDPGAFAAPGAPLLEIQDASQLRVTANTTPDAARTLRRGQSIEVSIEGQPVAATIEGVIPAMAGNLYTINALVRNGERKLLPGSTATVRIPTGEQHALLVPAAAIITQGDMTGVTVRTAAGDQIRWIRIARRTAQFIDVGAGLRPGDVVIVPAVTSAPAGK